MEKIKTFKRSLSFDYEEQNEQSSDRILTLSFSSTQPVQRWSDASEVLLHGSDNVDLTRLKEKAPLLFNHDWNRQIGVVEDVWLEGKKGYAKVRFSKQGFGDEVYQDVKDGIIRNISVGYQVLDCEFIRDLKEIHVSSWSPYEISFAPVPADISVGVGRSLGEDFSEYLVRKNQKEKKVMTESKIEEVKSYDDGLKAERSRTKAIQELAFENSMVDFARCHIEKGTSFENFERAMYKQMAESNRALLEKRQKEVSDKPIESTAIGLSDKETRNFSILKAVRAMNEPANVRAQQAAAMEFEASETFKRENQIYDSGLAIPSDVLMRDFMVGGEGGKIVPNQLQANSFVEMLRNRSVIMGLAQRLSGLKGNIQIPKQVGSSNVYWVGEKENVGQGDIKLDLIDLSPKTLGVYLDISEQMMINSTPDAETLVRNDLVAQMALGIDTAALYGNGGAKEPLGLFNSGVNVFEYLDDNPSYGDYVGLETQIATANADVNSMSYLINPSLRGKAKTTSKNVNQDATIWEQGGTINGYQTNVTNQVQNDHIFFGNFKDLIVGLWSGLILKTDPYTKLKSGVLTVVARQHVDFAVRRKESFAIAKKQIAE